jgi:hypothetical protein
MCGSVTAISSIKADSHLLLTAPVNSQEFPVTVSTILFSSIKPLYHFAKNFFFLRSVVSRINFRVKMVVRPKHVAAKLNKILKSIEIGLR